MNLLQKCPNRFALSVLEPFVKLNGLDSDHLYELNKSLREARENKLMVRDNKVAWDGLAIFALYVYFQVTDIADIADIAEHLSLARPTVKRWISAVYGAFDLPDTDFVDRATQRSALRLKVLDEGYIKDTSWSVSHKSSSRRVGEGVSS